MNWSTNTFLVQKSNGWNMFQKLWRKHVKGLLSVSFKCGCMTWRKKLNNSHVCWKCLLLLNQWGEKNCNKSFLFVICILCLCLFAKYLCIRGKWYINILWKRRNEIKRFLQKECHPILISLSMYVARCLRIKSLSSKPDFAQHWVNH